MLAPLESFRHNLLAWYDRHRRDLPWRVPPGSPPLATPDPYHVLISEAMLQQTQVATVVPYFGRFVRRFPTVHALAAADQQDVLRLWQGLGYYSRARNLHACAKAIVADHGGAVPTDVATLLTLPGVGRYTAGAVASLAHNTRAPIVDGNVVRVLCRLDQVRADPREKATQALLWARAEDVLPDVRCGDFNSALMELGATVCTPRNPHCLLCPVRAHCEAQAAGLQEQIPPPKKSAPTPLFERWVLCVRHGDRYLIHQRPAKGRWAAMWQFTTLEPTGRPTPAALGRAAGLPIAGPRPLGEVTHALTHRRYRFAVFAADLAGVPAAPPPVDQRWVTLTELDAYPLPKPHLKIAQRLRGGPG